jgi:hypothetical protein
MYSIGQQYGLHTVCKSSIWTSIKGINIKAVACTVLDILHET